MPRTRTLTLAPGDEIKFGLLLSAFNRGGDTIYGNSSRSREERDKAGKIIVALKEISTEANPETGLRRLLPAGGTLTLEQPQHEMLLAYVIAAPLPTGLSDQHIDIIDWIAAAPEDKKPGA